MVKNAGGVTKEVKSCRGCESMEEHKRIDGHWVCQWCGYSESTFSLLGLVKSSEEIADK